MITRVVLCGVGGQGTILAAHVLAEVALASDLDVKVSEIHGMSQRGGSVSTVVTFGGSVSSMVCGAGCADVLVSFDALETLRSLPLAREGGSIVSNDGVIKPSSVLTGKAAIPEGIKAKLEGVGAVVVPAEEMAIQAGNSHTSNIVMLGALSKALDFSSEVWEQVIASSVPARTIDANIAAFRLGREFAQGE